MFPSTSEGDNASAATRADAQHHEDEAFDGISAQFDLSEAFGFSLTDEPFIHSISKPASASASPYESSYMFVAASPLNDDRDNSSLTDSATATSAVARATSGHSSMANTVITSHPINMDILEPRKTERVPIRALVALALGRVVLLPAINLCAVVFLADKIIPDSPDRPLMKLVLAIESATPSADSIVVLCQQYGRLDIAEASV